MIYLDLFGTECMATSTGISEFYFLLILLKITEGPSAVVLRLVYIHLVSQTTFIEKLFESFIANVIHLIASKVNLRSPNSS